MLLLNVVCGGFGFGGVVGGGVGVVGEVVWVIGCGRFSFLIVLIYIFRLFMVCSVVRVVLFFIRNDLC